ncbi:hypothetical protein ACVWXO_010938 [Bradyrhizobium sp. LM2.7]
MAIAILQREKNRAALLTRPVVCFGAGALRLPHFSEATGPLDAA